MIMFVISFGERFNNICCVIVLILALFRAVIETVNSGQFVLTDVEEDIGNYYGGLGDDPAGVVSQELLHSPKITSKTSLPNQVLPCTS